MKVVSSYNISDLHFGDACYTRCRDRGYPDWGFSRFPFVPPDKSLDSCSSNWAMTLPFTSCSIHYSLTLKFDAIESELLIVSLNNE
jgi:hypothetical protein